MNIDRKHKYEISKPETIEAIRTAQKDNSFVIPSDYVYFLMNCNKLTFEEPPVLWSEGERFEFGEFYDLELHCLGTQSL